MQATFPDRSVLVVDDAYFVRHIIKRYLNELHFGEIYEAEDGEQLLEQYRLHKPDLVFMDLIMENMNGLIALDRLLQAHPHAKVIVISAVDIADLIRECIHIGAFDFIVKPFTRDKIQSAAIDALS